MPRIPTLIFLAASATLGAQAVDAAIPPGRQHRLTISGANTVTFHPEAGLAPVQIDYKARVEYIINTRYGKEPSATAEDDPAEETPSTKAIKKGSSKSRSRSKAADDPALRVSGAVDLSLHSTEMTFRQDGRPIVETRMTRGRFRGRLQPDSPALDVSSNEAPLRLQEILKNYDVVAASLLLNDDFKVVNRKYRFEGPQRAVVETLLSIHTPIPRGADSWESPTQLAMGHGQTARGKLRFEKEKPEEGKSSGDLVRVKVSGVLKAEGVVAGNFIKDGRYTVAGVQVYDAHTHEWASSRWSVEVANDLANQDGVTVAQAKGTMTVESGPATADAPAAVEPAKPRL